MSRKKRNKPKTVVPKKTVPEFMTAKIREIQSKFTVPMRVTIIARYPADPDAEVVFSDDTIDHVIAVLQRRRDAVVASQAGEAPPPTVAADQEQAA